MLLKELLLVLILPQNIIFGSCVSKDSHKQIHGKKILKLPLLNQNWQELE